MCPGFAPRPVKEHLSSTVCLPETDFSYKLLNEDELERGLESICLIVFQNFYSSVLSCLFQSKLANSVPSPNPVAFLPVFAYVYTHCPWCTQKSNLPL